MSIKAPRPQIAEQLEEGTYIARCYSMIHIGTIPTEWQGEKKKRNVVRIGFEFPTETKVFKEGDKPKPYVLSQDYTLSLGKKSKVRPMLEAWRGKKFTEEEIEEFDWTNLVGVPAMVTVVHNDKGYATIQNITKPPKGTECPSQVNPSQISDYDNFNTELFDKLPDFIKSKMMSSDEYKKMTGQEIEQDGEVDNFGDPITSDEVPF